MTKGRIGEIWGKMFGLGIYTGLITLGFDIAQGIATSTMSSDSIPSITIDAAFTMIQYAVLIPVSVIFLGQLYHHVQSANSAQPTA